MRCPDRGVSFPERRFADNLFPAMPSRAAALELEEGLRRVNASASGE